MWQKHLGTERKAELFSLNAAPLVLALGTHMPLGASESHDTGKVPLQRSLPIRKILSELLLKVKES